MYLSTAETICIYCACIVIVTMCLCMIVTIGSFVINLFKRNGK